MCRLAAENLDDFVCDDRESLAIAGKWGCLGRVLESLGDGNARDSAREHKAVVFVGEKRQGGQVSSLPSKCSSTHRQGAEPPAPCFCRFRTTLGMWLLLVRLDDPSADAHQY